jgi:hypothetical protein
MTNKEFDDLKIGDVVVYFDKAQLEEPCAVESRRESWETKYEVRSQKTCLRYLAMTAACWENYKPRGEMK